MKQRMAYLDGHRGLAILMVIFFHAYARWTDIVPYGNQYKFFFSAGLLGVQLFFLISGFVILLTLEKCSGIKEFLLRRWLRLFPAMLFCSLIIFLTAPFFYERPAGQPNLTSILPGLLFIEPTWISLAINEQISPLEGAFWSLYVEFKYYIISGFLYFSFGRVRLILSLLVLCTVGFVCQWLGDNLQAPYFQVLSKIGNTLSLQHFGWFAAGASAYIYSQTKDIRWYIFACSIAAYSAFIFKNGNWNMTFAALFVSAFFLISIVNQWIKRILSNRILQFFGFISYPLYLSHENVMIASIIKIGRVWDEFPHFLYPLIPISGLCLYSYICAKYIEPYIKKVLANHLAFNRQVEHI